VFTSLPGPPAVERVVYGPEGLLGALPGGSIYIDLTTNSPTFLRRIHADLAERGVEVLDVAVSGLPPAAHAGDLALFVGGDEAAFSRVEDALGALGPRVSYMGSIGAGMATKIIHNWICFGAIAVMTEGFILGKKAGVDITALYKAISDGSYGRGDVTKIFPDAIFEGKFDAGATSFGMPLSYARKDIGLATQLARELDVPMSLAGLVEQDYVAAVAQGDGSAKATPFVVTQHEQRAGVELRADALEKAEARS